MLRVKGLSKTFQKTTVVDQVSFSLKDKSCTALIGPNGAGKTTILRMIAGLIQPSHGEIYYGQDQEDYRRQIGYLPQYPKFIDWMTAEEFLSFCSQLYDLDQEATKYRIQELLELVGLNDVGKKPIRSYSGGMKQRLGIAQALVHRPKILLLDEPVSSLDPIGRREVLNLMLQLKKEMTILFSTHILNDAEVLSDGVLMIKNGRIIEDRSLKELQERYKTNKLVLESEQIQLDEVNALKQLPSIDHVEHSQDSLHLYVSDLGRAQKELFQFLLDREIEVSKVQVGHLTMEELFLKVVL